MTPMTLTLQAFLPFRTKQTLDFATLHQAGMFLVCGPTGSGKTSIFDAICFALYGITSGSRDTACLKSQFAEEEDLCFVDFTFESQGKRYRIYRTPIQMKKRRTGTVTQENATAELTMPDGQVLTKINEVNQRILEIVGLSAEQFRKIVMLPQGEFRRFLLDSSKDKQDILRKLFGTEACERMTEELRRLDGALTAELGLLRERQLHSIRLIEPMENSVLQEQVVSDNPNPQTVVTVTELLQIEIEASLQQKRKQQQTLQQQLQQLDLVSAERFNKRLLEYQQAEQTNQCLFAKKQQQEDDTALVETLSHVEEILRALDGIRRAEAELNRLQEQMKAWESQLPEAELAYLEAESKQNEVLAAQEALPSLTKQRAGYQVLMDAYQQMQQIQQREEKRARIAVALTQATQRFALQQRQQLLTERKQVLQSLAKLEQQKTNAGILATQALLDWEDANRHYFQNQAVMLATELQPGTPCPVCGSLTHPTPATTYGKAVTRAELTKLEQQYQQHKQALTTLQVTLQEKMQAIECAEVAPALAQVQQDIDVLVKQIADIPQMEAFEHYTQAEFDRMEGRLQSEQTNSSMQMQALAEILQGAPSKPELDDLIVACNLQMQSITANLQQTAQQFKHATVTVQRLKTAIEQSVQAQKSQQGLLQQQQQSYQMLLETAGLTTEQLPVLAKQLPNLNKLRLAVAQYQQQMVQTTAILESLTAECAGKSPFDLDRMQQQKTLLTEQYETVAIGYEQLFSVAENNRKRLAELAQHRDAYQKKSEEYGQLHLLYTTASGKNALGLSFERYLLGRYFDRVITLANLRLHSMTDGRYHLKRIAVREKGNASAGLDLEIFDAYCGRYRPVSSLSGGESFKTALCLALGLADSITEHRGGVEINTIFIDEGFGSLDQTALEQAMDCLFALRQSGRTIGMISHVDSLKDRISQKLLISRDPLGSQMTVTKS